MMNKELQKTCSGSIQNLATHFTISKVVDQYPYYTKGIIDDLRFYNRALTTNEIQLLYNE